MIPSKHILLQLANPVAGSAGARILYLACTGIACLKIRT